MYNFKNGCNINMKTYILNIIMLPLVIKKQGDGLNSYELGHSLVFLGSF